VKEALPFLWFFWFSWPKFGGTMTRVVRGDQWDNYGKRLSGRYGSTGWKNKVKMIGITKINMKIGIQWDRYQMRVRVGPKPFFNTHIFILLSK
jgi:hypothetical protein